MLRQYQQRFKYILVDEYQDTNVAQYLWLRLLAQAPSAAAGTALASPRGERSYPLPWGERVASEASRVRGKAMIESHLPPHPNPLPQGRGSPAQYAARAGAHAKSKKHLLRRR